jgi:DUF2971 family protein
MPSDRPRKIYRFQRFTARTFESLCHDQLHFADPIAFNDPLDCQPTVESDSDRGELRLILTELIRRRIEAEAFASLKNAKLTGQKASGHAKKLGEQTARNELANIAYLATDPDYEVSKEEAECRLLTVEIQRELLKRYDRGVCCFSSSVVNPLLWSHYGDQHRGLCVGYDLNRRPKPKLQKVTYGGSRTVVTSLIAKALLEKDPKSQELLDRNVLLRKASPWGYEREWRLLGNRGVHDSPLALKDVTFGLRCSIAVIHSVVAALENREDDVEFYEMLEVRGSFKLKRRSVDIDEIRAFLPYTARSGVDLFGPIDND